MKPRLTAVVHSLRIRVSVFRSCTCARHISGGAPTRSSLDASSRLLHTSPHANTARGSRSHASSVCATRVRRPHAAAAATHKYIPLRAHPPHYRRDGTSASSSASAASTAPSSNAHVQLSAQLRRSQLLAACPLLLSSALCTHAAAARAAAGKGVSASAPQHLKMLTKELLGVTGITAAASTADTASAADRSWNVFLLPLTELLCAELDCARRTGADSQVREAEDLFMRCLCQLLACTDVEVEPPVKAMLRALALHWTEKSLAAPFSTFSEVDAGVRSLLEAASSTLLPAVVESWQRHTADSNTSDEAGLLLARENAPATERNASFLSSPTAASSLYKERRWRPCMSEAAVKLCLLRIVQVLNDTSSNGGGGRDRQKGKEVHGGVASTASAQVSAERRQRLQRCCLCPLPPRQEDRTRHDCAIQTMGALKNAPFALLMEAYRYLEAEGHTCSVPVAMRFLSNCGMCVSHAAQRGVSLAVYLTEVRARLASRAPLPWRMENVSDSSAPRAALGPLLQARRTLVQSGRDAHQLAAGLLHINAVLNALDCAVVVRSFYARLPVSISISSPPATAPNSSFVLPETAHSVMSYVLLNDVTGAVRALAELGASRPEGWVSVQPVVMECMEAVSRLVGQRGGPADVDALYAALVSFHNAALFTSHHVERVLAGVCDRMRAVQEAQEQHGLSALWARQRNGCNIDVPKAPTPHDVVEQILPVVRVVLRYVGDELNADMILELVETALHVDEFAVPLTAALLWTFRAWMNLSLCLQELLCRVDASTQNVPFLQYYALCYARDFRNAAVFDHLAALWHVDGGAIWHREPHLSPPCQLWKCASCARLNSDRYNYCICTALRYSHALCAACGYAQDERLRQCRSCGTPLLSKAALADAMARKAWQCSDCGARNPAKQTLLCFRCGRPTGPRFHMKFDGSASRSLCSALAPFCECHEGAKGNGRAARGSRGSRSARQKQSDSLYAAAVGVCHTCGLFKMDYAAQHSAVWVCAGCQQRRSTLERICPSCPQVECLPHAVCSNESITLPRSCRHCRHEETNPFALVCPSCGSSEEPFRREEPTAASPSKKAASQEPAASAPTGEDVASVSKGSSSSSSQVAAVLQHWCFHCYHTQPWATCNGGTNGASTHQQMRCCESCGASCSERGVCALPPRSCSHCGAFIPARYAGSAVCPTCAAYVEPASQPAQRTATTSSAPAAVDAPIVWNAVTILHTCEVVERCCAAEVCRAETANATPLMLTAASPAGAALSFLQRRPRLEQSITRLQHAWCDTISAGSVAHDVSRWLSMRMDVVTVLGRALNKLRPRLAEALTARRLSALLKGVLGHVDHVCGAAATGCRDITVGRYSAEAHFTPEERCHLCLGTHFEELCPFREDGGAWMCAACGTTNDNTDVGRYVCAGCLALRPVMQDLLVSTCWECHDCHRANVQLERYCVHCGLERVNWSVAVLPPVSLMENEEEKDHAMESLGAVETKDSDAREGINDTATPEPSDDALPLLQVARDDEIPFVPAKCHLCGLVYIEARCPLCLNHIPDVADATGTVCEVQARCAFIQPIGTSRPQDRIYVDETLLHGHPLQEGLEVHYTAELGSRGRMQATFLRCRR